MIGRGEIALVAGGGSGWQAARFVFPAANRQPLPPKMGTKSRAAVRLARPAA
jgi:hypothetical protein